MRGEHRRLTASRFAEHPCGGAARPAKASIAPKANARLAGIGRRSPALRVLREAERRGSIELLGIRQGESELIGRLSSCLVVEDGDCEAIRVVHDRNR